MIKLKGHTLCIQAGKEINQCVCISLPTKGAICVLFRNPGFPHFQLPNDNQIQFCIGHFLELESSGFLCGGGGGCNGHKSFYNNKRSWRSSVRHLLLAMHQLHFQRIQKGYEFIKPIYDKLFFALFLFDFLLKSRFGNGRQTYKKRIR